MMESLQKKKVIKLIILTLLVIACMAINPMLMIFVGFLLAEFLPNSIAVAGAYLTPIIGIVLLTILCVDDVKMWLISLSVQFLVDVAFIVWDFFANGIGSVMEFQLAFVLPLFIAQAVGVGIKMFRHKIRKKG